MVRTYDVSRIYVSVNGIPITGFADGTFIKVTRAGDAYTRVVGADGVVSRAKSNDKSGEIAIILSQTSPSNKVLSSIALLDELSGGGVVPIGVSDAVSGSKYVAAHAWVRKQPDVEYGKEISNREWVLDCSNITFVTLGADLDG